MNYNEKSPPIRLPEGLYDDIAKEPRDEGIFTCTCATNDAVVNDGAAVDRNLQAVVRVVVLGRFIVRVELQHRQKLRDKYRKYEKQNAANMSHTMFLP